jgi:thiosulfate/3-mercaptopyruvate sulfurtransferase
MHPLISANELHATRFEVKIFDIRWSLLDPERGIATYRAGHIPGAVFVDLDADLAAPPGSGRHPLPTVGDFAATLGRLGLSEQDSVVVYDDARGTIAARMWWMLNSIGHTNVALLDGGFQTWVEAGYQVETGDHSHKLATYRPRRSAFTGFVDHTDIAGRTVIDVRDPSRYSGEHEPIDPKAGHIPGAINIPLRENLGEKGCFDDPEVLAARYATVETRPVVSCGSGVNACHTALAMILAGRELPDLYVGSFSDWSTRDLPVTTGSKP